MFTNVRDLREAKNLSLRELERLTGISYATISQIETGKYHPSDSQIEKLESVLDGEIWIMFAAKGREK